MDERTITLTEEEDVTLYEFINTHIECVDESESKILLSVMDTLSV